MSKATELREMGERVESLCSKLEMANITEGRSGIDLVAAEAKAGEIVAAISELDVLLTPKSKVPNLSSAERDIAFTKAIIGIGQKLAGGQVFAQDVFQERVVIESSGDAQDYLARQTSGMFLALLRDYAEIASVVADAGVSVWAGPDNRVRVVNAKWLTDENLITAFVTAPAEPGRRCRFCRAVEFDDNFELQPIDPDRRGKLDVLVSGVSGRKQVVLDPGQVHTHVPCAKFWNEWVEIARKIYREAAA